MSKQPDPQTTKTSWMNDYEMTNMVIKEFLPDWNGQDHVDLDYGNLQAFAARLLDAYKTRFVVHKGIC
jgi:hypothetical protein